MLDLYTYKSREKRAPISSPSFFLWSTVIGHALGLSVPTTKDETKIKNKNKIKLNEINVMYTFSAGGYRSASVPNKFQLTSPGVLCAIYGLDVFVCVFYFNFYKTNNTLPTSRTVEKTPNMKTKKK